MPPLVSVVVPVFNGLPHLEALASCLLAQTYPNLEIVFSDGGSADESLTYLKKLNDPRILILEQPPGTSAAANWTKASQAATGEFTKLICQDDLLSPQAISRQVQDLLQHPRAVMATALRDIIDAHGTTVFRNRGLAGLQGRVIPAPAAIRACYVRGTNVIGEPLTVLFRTKALQSELPWLDANPLMLDLSMYAKVAELGDLVIRRESVGAFRVSKTSWSTHLANSQVHQTREWQKTYAAEHLASITQIDRVRAALGRTTQTSLRRIAYLVLAARGRLTATTEQPTIGP